MELLNSVLAVVPLWLLWPLIVGIAVYWYLTRNYNHWKQVGIPYVPAVPILGSFGKTLTNPANELEMERYRTLGRIYGAFEGSRATLTVGDPDVLKDILVKDFQVFTSRRAFSSGNAVTAKMASNLKGEDWKRVRTIITPTFTTGKIKKVVTIIMDCAQTLTVNFRKAANEGKPIDVKRYFGAFTMDVIASSAFGTKLDSHNDPENPFATAARSVFNTNISWRVIVLVLFPRLQRFLGIDPFGPRSSAFFKKVTLKIVQERKKSGQRRNDFLQMLMDAEKALEKDGLLNENDAVSEMGHEENNYQIFKPLQGTKSLSNEELVAQCVAFFIGGYDTTASTMTFTAYELALNPDIQEKLIAEVDQAIQEKGELCYEAIAEMKYLDRVISETMRKYPPAIRTERIADDDYVIKKYDVPVTKGMIVGIPIYAIHHDPEFYPDPEKYDPERFTPEMKATRHPYSYLPFGAGPRNCVAMRFALMEVKVCMAYAVSQFRFHTCSQTAIPPKYYLGQGLLTPKNMILKVEVRHDAPKV